MKQSPRSILTEKKQTAKAVCSSCIYMPMRVLKTLVHLVFPREGTGTTQLPASFCITFRFITMSLIALVIWLFSAFSLCLLLQTLWFRAADLLPISWGSGVSHISIHCSHSSTWSSLPPLTSLAHLHPYSRIQLMCYLF